MDKFKLSAATMKLKIAKPSIVSYLHYAHDLSIIEAHDAGQDYLATAFLQLHTKPDKSRKDLLLDFCHYWTGIPMHPCLVNELISGVDLQEYGATPAERVCSIIDSGCYARVDLNEFHIKGTISYQKPGSDLSKIRPDRRPLHFNLIYGYCRQDEVFFAHGFNEMLNYSDRKITFQEFEKAYYGDEVGIRKLRFMPREDHAYQLYDAEVVIQYLNDFIDCRGSEVQRNLPAALEKFISAIPFFGHSVRKHPLGNTFGMATYDAAIKVLSKANGTWLDIRPWCILLDHKQSLLRLCDFLMKKKGVHLNEMLLGEFKAIHQDFFNLRNYLLEAKLAGRKAKLSLIRANLARLKEVERRAIAELIGIISRNAQVPNGFRGESGCASEFDDSAKSPSTASRA